MWRETMSLLKLAQIPFKRLIQISEKFGPDAVKEFEQHWDKVKHLPFSKAIAIANSKFNAVVRTPIVKEVIKPVEKATQGQLFNPESFTETWRRK
jgi:hypothetical protein